MLHRHRFLILAICLTGIIVAVCLFVPEMLLTMEEKGSLGKVQQGQNQYYAADVSDDNMLAFNFQRRLMMLSGQWKSNKEEAQVLDGMLDREKFIGTCIFTMLTMISDVERILDASERAYFLDLLFQQGLGNVEENSDDLTIRSLIEPGLAELMLKGNATLYKYTDSILNSYAFYAWEYSFQLPGIELYFMIDAVTLDMYSMNIRCDYLTEVISWEKMLYDSAGELYNSVAGIGDTEQYYDITGVIIGWVNPMIVPLKANHYISVFNADYMEGYSTQAGAWALGYTYQDNFFADRNVEAEFFDEFTMKLQKADQVVYACLKIKQGLEFYFSCEEP